MMQSLIAFARQDIGAILGAVLIFMGITGFILFQRIVLPKMRRERRDPKALETIVLLHRVSIADAILFCGAGTGLLYFHFWY